jgi:hypothetical protein
MSKPWETRRLAAWLLAAPVLLAGCSHHEPSGGPIEVKVCFGEVGLSPGQFSYPRCLDHDQTSLWTIDKQARVQRLDPKTGQWIGGWQMPEWEHGKPTGVTAWEPDGADGPLIFIPDTHYFRVMVYDGGPREKGAGGAATINRSKQGTLLTRFGENGTGPGQLIWPTDLAILPTPDGKSIQRLYVSEYSENDRITVYEPDVPVNKETLLAMMGPEVEGAPRATPRIAACPFKYKFAIGHYGSGTSPDDIQFNRPQSMAIDLNRRELIVTDACNHRLGRFTLDGKLIAWISGPDQTGEEPGHFKYPYGLCLLEDGTALVSEFGGNRVQHIDVLTGESLGIYGQAGRGPGQLASPWGIAVMGRMAYVLDSGNNRVIGFDAPKARKQGAESQNTAAAVPISTSHGGHG